MRYHEIISEALEPITLSSGAAADRGMFDIFLGGKRVGNVSVTTEQPIFITSIFLEKDFRGKGLAKDIYDAVERRMGSLIPSPSLTVNAQHVWRKRLSRLPPKLAKQMVDASYQNAVDFDGVLPKAISNLQAILPEWKPKRQQSTAG